MLSPGPALAIGRAGDCLRLWEGASIIVTSPIRQSTSQDRQQILASLFIGYSWIATRLQLNQLILQFQSGSHLLSVCVTNAFFRCCELCDANGVIGTQRSAAPYAGVWVVVIYFGVIAIYFKNKLVLSITVISGIDQWPLYYGFKGASAFDAPRRDALNLRIQWMTSSRELINKIAAKVKAEKFVFNANSKQTD